MKTMVPLRLALKDKGLLSHVLAGPSWLPWRALLIAAMGEPLTEDERPIFTRLTAGLVEIGNGKEFIHGLHGLFVQA